MSASTTSTTAPVRPGSLGDDPVVGPVRPARPNAWLAAVGVWAALGLFSFIPAALPDESTAPDAAQRVVYHVVHILTLGALTGSVVWVTRRTESWSGWLRVAVHVGLAAAFASAVAFAGAAALRTAAPDAV